MIDALAKAMDDVCLRSVRMHDELCEELLRIPSIRAQVDHAEVFTASGMTRFVRADGSEVFRVERHLSFDPPLVRYTRTVHESAWG